MNVSEFEILVKFFWSRSRHACVANILLPKQRHTFNAKNVNLTFGFIGNGKKETFVGIHTNFKMNGTQQKVEVLSGVVCDLVVVAQKNDAGHVFSGRNHMNSCGISIGSPPKKNNINTHETQSVQFRYQNVYQIAIVISPCNLCN